MAADVLTSPVPRGPGGSDPRADLQAAQRQFWLDAAAALAAWGRGLLACLAGAAVMQGVLSAFPAVLWLGIPVTLPLSALIIALVGLRCAPQWGSVFAACAGLLADAAGPAQLGGTAWAYLPVAVCFTLVHRRLRRDHAVTLILYAASQAFAQTSGTYLGLRWAGLTETAGHIAGATVLLSVVLTALAAAVAALVLRFVGAVNRQVRRAA